MVKYSDVVRANFDAGLYREFIANVYGRVLAFGGSMREWGEMKRHTNALSRLTKIDVNEIRESIRQDYYSKEN